MTGRHSSADLAPSVWPCTAARNGDGALEIGGLDVRRLVQDYGTPLLVLDEEDLRQRCRSWRAAFDGWPAGADVAYAGKALLTKGVVTIIGEEGLGLDVCTGGELAVALAAGFPPERIWFHGNNKSLPELTRAVGAGVRTVVIDSFEEVHRLAAVAAEAGTRQRVYVRVTPGVEAHTHEYVQTGQEDQKFGFSLASGAAMEACQQVIGEAALELVGLHCHIGSHIFDTHGFSLAAHRMVELLAAIRAECGLELPELDLGGGHGIAYTAADDPMSAADHATGLRAIVERECGAVGLAIPRVVVEPGRAVVGPTTITVYEVGTVKVLPGLRTYVSVDGGMSDNIRTALYDARYTAVLASRQSSAEPRNVTICGKHCESGDIVVHDVALPGDLAPGDLVAVPASGAYHRSMASNYNHVPRPPIIAVRAGTSRVLIRRETEDDLLALDVG
ncbi:MAG TPA: diaminopimelate decarboxylase [Mycobacteriales bacterium]|nr:diaminopimelate decarboxylase [Mycobacteriales bacterium]